MSRKPREFRPFVRYPSSTLSNCSSKRDKGKDIDVVLEKTEKCQKGVSGESGIQSASALPTGREIPVVAKDSVQDTVELATSGGSVLVADIKVSRQGVRVQDSVLTTQSKSSSQKCEDATGSVCVVPPLGCSNEILLTDCLSTCSDPDVPCHPVVKTDKTVEQGSEYHGFSTSSEVSKADVLDVTLAEVSFVVWYVSGVVLRQVKTCAADGEDVSHLTPAFNLSPSLPHVRLHPSLSFVMECDIMNCDEPGDVLLLRLLPHHLSPLCSSS